MGEVELGGGISYKLKEAGRDSFKKLMKRVRRSIDR